MPFLGYGDIVCYTTAGRIATVLYAMVGIPLMLSALNDLGKFLFELINTVIQSWHKFQQKLSTIMGRHRRNRQQQPNPDTVDADQNTSLMKSSAPSPDDIVRFHLASESSKSAGGASSEKGDDDYDDDDVVIDVDDIVDRSPPPRIPVSVAIIVTVGWIFVCAGLFCLWEHNWTYMESCYFFFISLSTIGK